MNQRKRYVIVGVGGRSENFRDAILETYSDTCQMVGLCDNNAGRLALAVDHARQKGTELTGFAAEEFDQMIMQTKPDCVVVTSQDSAHDDYICRAMELGCDVITEKPMTIDVPKCKRILDMQKRTGKKLDVAFNYRYSKAASHIKELLMSGVIGKILSVDFHWLLETYHGSDYFRRWHRNKENSGGLMVHKSTHHFDLINWWLGSVPETVWANGKKGFYTPETAAQYGLTNRGERCHDCIDASRCPFFLDIEANKNLKRLYLDNEIYDGYIRDRCVFSPDIDIEDTINVSVSYRNGVTLSYSLNAFTAWEGHIVSFNGTGGRIEHHNEESVYINGDGTVPGMLNKEGTWTRVYPHRQAAYNVEVGEAKGGHGGADPLIMQAMFASETLPADQSMRQADHRDGAWSIMTGIAANHAMATRSVVNINDLFPNLEEPEYPSVSLPTEPMIPLKGIEASV